MENDGEPLFNRGRRARVASTASFFFVIAPPLTPRRAASAPLANLPQRGWENGGTREQREGGQLLLAILQRIPYIFAKWDGGGRAESGEWGRGVSVTRRRIPS